MDYRPQPIDTSAVELRATLCELVEQLAESAHDHWALQRMADGWRYGERRDDEQKRHPDLVPYDDLPESEKEYDRRMVTETIKAIVSLGYRIERG